MKAFIHKLVLLGFIFTARQGLAEKWTIASMPHTFQTLLSIESLATSAAQPRKEWYGLPLILTDVGSLGLLLLPISNEPKAILSLTNFLVTPFLIHAFSVKEGQKLNRVLRSAALRLGAPITTGLLGYLVAKIAGSTFNPHNLDGLGYVVVGAMIGGLGGIITDYVLATKDR